MSSRPEFSDLEFVGTQSFGKSSLPDEYATVFDELGIRVRGQEALVYEHRQTGEQYNVKFAGMNFYPTNSRANPEGAKDCYQNGIAAIGWNSATPEKMAPQEYMKSIADSPDDVHRHDRDAAHFLLWLEEDGIILTSNKFGETAYHYAWVTSEPRHVSEADDEELRNALNRNSFGFYRHVDWIEVPQEDAPGPVTSMTLRGRTLANKDMGSLAKHQIIEQFDGQESDEATRIDDQIDYSTFGERLRKLAAKKTRGNSNQLLEGLSATSSHNGFEDVVCSYIQHITEGKIKPATQYNPVIEYLFRGIGEDGEALTFGVQVKKGGFDTNRGRLKEFARHHDRLYLFSASGDTIDGENIVNIGCDDLVEYICERPQELDPTEIDRLRRRLDIYESTVESQN